MKRRTAALLSLFGIVSALLCCELMVRVYLWISDPAYLLGVRPAPPIESSPIIRILSAGESSMVGEPYQANFDIPRIVRAYLERSVPGKSFRLEYQAGAGRDLHGLFPSIVEHLRTNPPHLFVLMFGHNDFLSNYGTNLECSERESNGILLATRSALFRLLYERVQRARIGQRPTAGQRRMLDAPVVCPGMSDYTLRRFGSDLENLAEIVELARIPSVFVFPASNEASFDPNRSVYNGSARERARFETIMRCGLRFSQRRQARSLLACMEKGSAIDPSFALLQYLRGKALHQLGRDNEARGAFYLAKEHDGYPWRALSRQRSVMAQIANDHGILFIDAPSLLTRASPSGLLDEALFHDIHHPSLLGYHIISQEIIRRVLSVGLFGATRRTFQSMSHAEVATHFNFTRSDLLSVFVSRVEWLLLASRVGFDPTERMTLLRRNLDAAMALDSVRAVRALGKAKVDHLLSLSSAVGMSEDNISEEACADVCGLGRLEGPSDSPEVIEMSKGLIDLYPYVSNSDSRAVHIGDLASSARYALMTSLDGKGAQGGPLTIKGEQYSSGFTAHPSHVPSEVVFDLPGRYARLSGAVGVTDLGSERSSVRCFIESDGVRVFSSPLLRRGDPLADFVVPLKDVKQIRLICDDAGDGHDYDQVAWVKLRLER